HGVPIHHSPVLIGKEGAIGIAIKGDAQVASPALYLGSDNLGMQSATVFVDVSAIGSVMYEIDFHPEHGKQFRRDTTCGAVCAVNHEVTTCQIGLRDPRFQPSLIIFLKPMIARQCR